MIAQGFINGVIMCGKLLHALKARQLHLQKCFKLELMSLAWVAKFQLNFQSDYIKKKKKTPHTHTKDLNLAQKVQALENGDTFSSFSLPFCLGSKGHYGVHAFLIYRHFPPHSPPFLLPICAMYLLIEMDLFIIHTYHLPLFLYMCLILCEFVEYFWTSSVWHKNPALSLLSASPPLKKC